MIFCEVGIPPFTASLSLGLVLLLSSILLIPIIDRVRNTMHISYLSVGLVEIELNVNTVEPPNVDTLETHRECELSWFHRWIKMSWFQVGISTIMAKWPFLAIPSTWNVLEMSSLVDCWPNHIAPGHPEIRTSWTIGHSWDPLFCSIAIEITLPDTSPIRTLFKSVCIWELHCSVYYYSQQDKLGYSNPLLGWKESAVSWLHLPGVLHRIGHVCFYSTVSCTQWGGSIYHRGSHLHLHLWIRLLLDICWL